MDPNALLGRAAFANARADNSHFHMTASSRYDGNRGSLLGVENSSCFGVGATTSTQALKQTLASPLSPSDSAVAAYGTQLKAWVELQVDTRLKQVLSGFFDVEFANARCEARTALGISERCEEEVEELISAQARLASIVEGLAEEMKCSKAAMGAIRATAEDVAQLNTRCHRHDMIVADLQRCREADLSHVRHHEALLSELQLRESNSVAVAAAASAALCKRDEREVNDMEVAVGKMVVAVEELRCNMEREESERRNCVSNIVDISSRLARHEDKVDELRSGHESHARQLATVHASEQRFARQAEAAQGDLEERVRGQIHSLKLGIANLEGTQAAASLHAANNERQFHDRMHAEFRDSRASLDGSRAGINDAAIAQLLSALESRLLTSQRETDCKLRAELEGKLAMVTESVSCRTEASAAVGVRAEFNAMQPEVRLELAEQRALLEELRARVTSSQARLEAGLEALAGQAQAVEARLDGGLAALQKRLAAELRAETVAAIRTEKSAVAALDEQLWLTDQRLGQRIDELAQLQVRERLAVDHRYDKFAAGDSLGSKRAVTMLGDSTSAESNMGTI